MTIHKERIKNKKNPKLKLFKLLNDELFWLRFNNVCTNPYRITLLRQYRTKCIIPSRVVLKSFIEEDYKYITSDTRETREITLELLSE